MSTFSSRVHESRVQFVEPVHTAAPSRTTYLWCMRSGSPGIARSGTPSCSSSDGSVRGGGGSGLTARSPSWLKAMRTATPRAAAARIAPATVSPTGPGQAHVVEGDVERALRRAEPADEPIGDRLGRLPAVDERALFDHARAGSASSAAARSSASW